MQALLRAYRKHGLPFFEGVTLAPYTTLRVGGPARCLVTPKDYQQACLAVDLAFKVGVPVFFLGGGSNLLVRDGGMPGVVVDLKGLNQLRYLGKGLVEAEAGVSLGALLRFCRQKGLSGLEFLAGVPATVGGIVRMNAGAFGYEVKDLLQEVTVWYGGQVETLRAPDLKFVYRCWGGPSGALILKALFLFRPLPPEDIEERLRYFLGRRRDRQPVGEATAGCIFKNPEGIAAGFLLDKIGLKGFTHGRAHFSRKHANFIVTKKGAKAEDVLFLIDKAKEEVMRAFGIELREEVVVVGEA